MRKIIISNEMFMVDYIIHDIYVNFVFECYLHLNFNAQHMAYWKIYLIRAELHSVTRSTTTAIGDAVRQTT